MKKIVFRSLPGLGLCLLLACQVLGQAESRSPRESLAKSPNVILVICDDLNDSLQGMEGHPQARTPSLDRLMEQGVRFSRELYDHENDPNEWTDLADNPHYAKTKRQLRKQSLDLTGQDP